MSEHSFESTPYVVEKGQTPVGVLNLSDGEVEAIKHALEGAGYKVSEGKEAPDGAIDLNGECAIDNPRPCELTVGLGMVRMFAQEAGVDSSKIDAIEEQGSVTEEEAKSVMEEVVRSLPEDWKPQGEEAIKMTFEEVTVHVSPEPEGGNEDE